MIIKMYSILLTVILLASYSAFAQTIVLNSNEDVLATARHYSATILFFGHGSKSQFADVPTVLSEIDKVIARLDQTYGKGNWLASFGGDSFNPEKPDIALVMKHLKDSGVPILAIQSDVVIQWGGVDRYIDFVHYVPTTRIPEIGADGKTIFVDGQMKTKVVWGGFISGKPAGPTATYLGPDFISGPNPLVKAIVAVGGGPIALEEVKYANQNGVFVKYIRAEARFPEVNGKYGSVDVWANSRHALAKSSASTCEDIFSRD